MPLDTTAPLYKALGSERYYALAVDMLGGDSAPVRALLGDPPRPSARRPIGHYRPLTSPPPPPPVRASRSAPVSFAEVARMVFDSLFRRATNETFRPRPGATPPRFTPYVATRDGRLTPKARARGIQPG